ncbi:MAG: SMP-30/gluconolactonase/LRE family protein, partial [Chitinophagaceae bacterium]
PMRSKNDTSILISKGSELQLVSKQFAFTEGPAADRSGNVYFTDQPNNKIWKYGIDGTLSVFMDTAGRANGLYFDKKGNLVACADELNQLWSITPKGAVTVLVKDFEGQRLNGPNDLWIGPKGNIYITDPYYQRPYWDRKSPEIKGDKVYYLPRGKKKLKMVADSLIKPNGIIGTPDGKYLYVSDLNANKTYRFRINKNGTLKEKTLFISKGSDGMAIDSNGNIYITGNGVAVYNPAGELIEQIDVPEKWTANVCFGGINKNELFITASKAIYKINLNVRGAE